MKRFSKFFLAVLLLTVASASWAACPEGTKNNYKGECVPIAGGSTGSTTNKKALDDVEYSVSSHPIDFKARQKAILDLVSDKSDDRLSYCKRDKWVNLKTEPTVRIWGPARITAENPTMAGAGQSTDVFMISLYRLLANYVYGEEGMAEKIYSSLLEGARSDAYVEVEVDLEGKKLYGEHYNPWEEPTYYQSMLLWPLAYAYTLLADKYGEEDDGLSEIRAWGDRILASSDTDKVQWVRQDGSVRGIDRAAIMSAAYSIWGNATGNEDALTRGHSHFRHVMQTIGKSGQDVFWHKDQEILDMGKAVKYASMTVGPALFAADALRRSGAIDVFDYAPKGGNIKEGSAWLIDKAFATNDPVTSQPRKQFGGLAWVELFIVLFPDHPVSKMADEKLNRGSGGLETFMTGGGPATCFYRDIESA